jgi:hypothetical protein
MRRALVLVKAVVRPQAWVDWFVIRGVGGRRANPKETG